jgi:hypothetical protein
MLIHGARRWRPRTFIQSNLQLELFNSDLFSLQFDHLCNLYSIRLAQLMERQYSSLGLDTDDDVWFMSLEIFIVITNLLQLTANKSWLLFRQSVVTKVITCLKLRNTALTDLSGNISASSSIKLDNMKSVYEGITSAHWSVVQISTVPNTISISSFLFWSLRQFWAIYLWRSW